jgi:KamA family protein
MGHREPYRVFTLQNYRSIPQLRRLGPEVVEEIAVVGQVLPFRVNGYVLEHLIDWERAPDDPMYRLVFPNRDMLAEEDYAEVAGALRHGEGDRLRGVVAGVRQRLDPHPDGQKLNVPVLDGEPVAGMQHKYRETLLFFPREGQTCHSYCTYCFRWAQFVGDAGLRFASRERDALVRYLEEHPEITDILITGGDPLVMNARRLGFYLEPLLEGRCGHVQNIRIGTKALTYRPQRFLIDEDADELLRLFERVVDRGKSLALMAHFVHWREVEAGPAVEAIRRIRGAGAVVRGQGPVLAHINDRPEVWRRMWESQVRLGVVPYYFFLGRATGAHRYFEVPLARAVEIYQQAVRRVSGLGRTARGPVMSASPGKVEVQGVVEAGGERLFALRLLQARNPEWAMQPFFARFSPTATWLDDLTPAFGADRFFFQQEDADDRPSAHRPANGADTRPYSAGVP